MFADPFAQMPMAPPALAPHGLQPQAQPQQPLWAPHVERWTGERWVEHPPQVPRPPPFREFEAWPDRYEQNAWVPRHSTGELFGKPIALGPALGDESRREDRYREERRQADAARDREGAEADNARPDHREEELRKESRRGSRRESRNEQDNAGDSDKAASSDKAKEHDASVLAAVHEYFSLDPHNRVKVTAEYLERRFFDEEKYLDSLYQLPKFPLNNTSREHQLVLVGFKAGRVDVFYLPESPALSALQVGDLVMVEADRGKDLGKVLKFNVSIDQARLLKLLDFLEQQAALNEHSVDDLSVKQLHHHELHLGHSATNAPPILHAPKAVLALAQPREIHQILNKKQDEEKACRLCLSKLANAMGSDDALLSDLLHMKLIDAEYQFDRRKLIFYYSTMKRIDFRDLVRELFRIYKTRIWMCAVSGAPVALKQKSRQRHAHAAVHEEPQKKKPWLAGGIPRKFNELASSDPVAIDGGESLVLKSLVDTLDH